jgi:DNA-binding winged helix-turn-helix (wHTH) protein
MKVRLGDTVIDTDRRQLFRAGEAVAISPKGYQLLALLLDARPKALSKQDLHEALWPDTFVVEANLSNLVGEIRAALGDSSRQPRIIRTLHRFGYAFAAEPDAIEDAATPLPFATCWLRRDWEEFPLRAGENIVGRGAEAHVRLEASGVSRRHARIVVGADRVFIEDLGSKNGTAVRGERLSAARPLADGDDISIGSVRVLFRLTSAAGATTDTLSSVDVRPARPDPR